MTFVSVLFIKLTFNFIQGCTEWRRSSSGSLAKRRNRGQRSDFFWSRATAHEILSALVEISAHQGGNASWITQSSASVCGEGEGEGTAVVNSSEWVED